MLRGEPLKASLATALREAEGLGGQERRFAALAVRELSRHQRLLDLAARTLGHPPGKVGLTEDQALVRYALWRRLFCGERWSRIGPEVKLPGPVRPRTIKDDLLARVVEDPLPEPPQPDVGRRATGDPLLVPHVAGGSAGALHPEPVLEALLAALDEEPALHFRVRPSGTRAEVLAQLTAEGVAAEPVELAPDAVRISDASHRVFETKVMKSGRLQVQDVGSQLIAEVCRPPGGSLEGLTVADVCAGAGGKTLALADMVGTSGRVLAGDRSRKRLAQARERVRDLSVRNVSFPHPLPLSGVDVLLVDAPCSGTGSLGREPDQKWKLTPKAITDFQTTQLGAPGGGGARGPARSAHRLRHLLAAARGERRRGGAASWRSSRASRWSRWRRCWAPERAAALCDGPYLRPIPPESRAEASSPRGCASSRVDSRPTAHATDSCQLFRG